MPAAEFDPLALSIQLGSAGERSDLFTRARSGRAKKLFPGGYMLPSEWERMDGEERHRALIDAAARKSRRPLIVSHQSAAALWRLTALRPWPERVHVLQARGSTTRSTASLIRHSDGIPEHLANIDGHRVTDLAHTVVDLAATVSFREAVVFADAALRRLSSPYPSVPGDAVTPADVEALIIRRGARPGMAHARRVLEFADGRADRPGESVSRVSIFSARISRPDLQVPVFGISGSRYFADFYWADRRHIGEFDGAAKYTDPQFLRGRTPQQALLDEKRREDDLRAAGYRFTRWGWEVALSPARLGALLRQAGIR
ncbi:MAG: hypothetical protein JWN36_2914 [Microbacteriaceae bacterium]|nr:hypothetical protein [Microbacteriaceae bacterium]